MTTQEVLQQCTVKGDTVKLPEIKLDRKEYLDVANALQLIGGKWKGGKVQGFVFPEDPTELLTEIAAGKKRNLKKEFQFFETPADLATQIAEIAALHDHCSILEPSAGSGSLMKAAWALIPELVIDYCEIMPINQKRLEKLPRTIFAKADFLELAENPAETYDRIIANPPFSKDQDIQHIQGMYKLLSEGGRLVSVASCHWTFASTKRCVDFREWLNSVGAHVLDIEDGAFKESGTSVSTKLIVIDK